MAGTAEVIDIPNVKIEFDPEGGPDAQILLEQDWTGNVDRVSLHPSQVRLIAERLGMLPPSDIEAHRTIARLCRQMRTLYQRIDQLDDWLNAVAQRGHEDLDMECTFSMATWEIAREFLIEAPDGLGIDGNPPKSGPVESPQKRGHSASNPSKSGGTGSTGELPLEGGQA
jgi:hypothetical protein